MASKQDFCEICNEYTLVADYGLHGEFICVDCSLNDEKLSNHVVDEMERRHGKKKMGEIVCKALNIGTRH